MAPNARLLFDANDSLRELQQRLESEKGITASRDQIVSALVHGVTVAQAAGMLPAFISHAAGKSEENYGE